MRERRLLALLLGAWIVLGSAASYAGLTQRAPSFRRYSLETPAEIPRPTPLDTGNE